MELVRVETQQHRAQVDFLLMGIDGGINVGAIERSIDFDVLGQSINISVSETTADSEVSLLIQYAGEYAQNSQNNEY